MVWTSVERSPIAERSDTAQKIATQTLAIGQRTGMGHGLLCDYVGITSGVPQIAAASREAPPIKVLLFAPLTFGRRAQFDFPFS